MDRADDRPAVLRKRLEAFTGELPGIEQGAVEAVHRARVASRRLRELLPLLQLDRPTSRKLAKRFKTATSQLGRVRELDVLMELIAELGLSERYSPAVLARLAVAVGPARDAARGRFGPARARARLEKLGRKLEQAAASTGHGPRSSHAAAWKWAMDARLARRADRLRSAIDHAGSLYAAGPLHDVRIAIKKLRYAAELSDETGGRLTASIATLKSIQDVLGRIHDLEVLLEWSRSVEAALKPLEMADWRALKSLARAIEADCRELHARYMRRRQALLAIAHRLSAGRPADKAGERLAGRASHRYFSIPV